MLPVYIIILNYKNWQDTRDCLESVFRSSSKGFSVIVIDNDSQNGSLEHLMLWAEKQDIKTVSSDAGSSSALSRKENMKEMIGQGSLPRLSFIQNNTNAGFAGGINPALDFLKEENAYLWLLNPDMIVAENTLTELLRYAAQQPMNSIIGAEIRLFSSKEELYFYGGGKINFHSATIREASKATDIPGLDYISGGCMFTHAENFRKQGFLPEEYFLYWEETDWCYRAKKNGFQIKVCREAICYDKISTTIGKSFLADYYYTRNGLLFLSKYRKKNIPIALFFVGLRFFKRVITGQWKRAKGVYKGTFDFLKWKPDENK